MQYHREQIWNGADCVTLNRASSSDDEYRKSNVLHLYLFGYELPDTVLLLTKDGKCTVLATKKKCEFLEQAMGKEPNSGSINKLELLVKSKGDNNANNYETLLKLARGDSNGEAVKIGLIKKEFKTDPKDGTVMGWEKKIEESDSNLEVVDCTHGLSMVMAVKEQYELDLMKKSSVLSNKVLKHSFIKEIEDVIENNKTTTHEAIAEHINDVIDDPSKINLKVPTDLVQSCYFPIIQSGGDYDFKVSAESSSENVKFDIITVMLGSRYQNYCSNIGRTLLIDPPKQVQQMYDTLLGVHEAALKAMVPGKPLKAVHAAAVKYLRDEGKENLVSSLPKALGFSVGLDFRDGNLLLNSKSTVPFKAGMVFNLAVSFSGLTLSSSARASANDDSAVSIY